MHNGNSIKLIGMCFALMCQNGATPGETKAIYLFQRVYISHLGIPCLTVPVVSMTPMLQKPALLLTRCVTSFHVICIFDSLFCIDWTCSFS